MDYSALTATGTIGWLLVVGWSMARGCFAGQALGSIFAAVLESFLVVEFWAIAPVHLGADSHHPPLLPLWVAAIFPYVLFPFYVLYRLCRPAKQQERGGPHTPPEA